MKTPGQYWVEINNSTDYGCSATRFEMLLLLAHLVSFVQRLIGESAKAQQQFELRFMATHRAARREISVFTLGRRILDTAPHCLRQLEPWRAITPLSEQAASACVALT
jgi:hypothetical protein